MVIPSLQAGGMERVMNELAWHFSSKKAVEMELEPYEWFNNVEMVVANRIGRETVQYVINIYKVLTKYE